ncbi:MAG: hypothetical protein HY757_06935 [Nitrospirae bacterium]|nr:hypothetical protein [Nitrospirota bacterium]
MREEVTRFKSELAHMESKNSELTDSKDMLSELQKKFDEVKNINAKLKESINKLIPEANRTREHEQVIRDIEQSYAELDSLFVILRKEKERLNEKSKSSEGHIDKLEKKLKQSVSKEEFDNLKARNKSLELKFDKLKKDLEDKTGEYESLQKNYIWLEKEYNALYNNISHG